MWQMLDGNASAPAPAAAPAAGTSKTLKECEVREQHLFVVG
jgi:hypothetical protein